MVQLSLACLTAIYLRIGSLTFGGGDPTMAALQNELVERRRWLPPAHYGLVYALARVTPGTNVLAFSAGTAWQLLGWRGAVAAVLAVTLPSAVLAVLLTAGYDALRHYPRAMAAIGGTLAAAVGMMVTGAWQLLSADLASRDVHRALRAVVLAGGALLLSFALHFSPVAVLALAAAAGFFWQAPDRA